MTAVGARRTFTNPGENIALLQRIMGVWPVMPFRSFDLGLWQLPFQTLQQCLASSRCAKARWIRQHISASNSPQPTALLNGRLREADFCSTWPSQIESYLLALVWPLPQLILYRTAQLGLLRSMTCLNSAYGAKRT